MNDDQLKNYQDDLDTDPNKTDPITEEETDALADRAGIPEHELAHELKKLNFDEEEHGPNADSEHDEDMREQLEDADENMGQAGKR
jgi:hypothetical protein